MAEGSIVARERELEAISAFLDLDGAGGGVLVLEGEAGIGKTTLWRAATHAASEGGCRVLETRPSAAEAGFAFSGLADLLAGSIEGIGTALPAPQVAALEIALLRREAVGRPADPRAVSAGVLGAVRALAAQSPVVVAIDDVHWLDRESAAALAYAFRRLDEHPVRLIASLRLDPAIPPSELLEAVARERATRIRIGPMSAGALHRAIRMHLDRTLPRPVLLRVHQLASGNPFYALELARSLPDDPRTEFTLPPTLERVTQERLNRLAAPVRRLLEPVALLTNPTATLLEGLGDDAYPAGEALDTAVAAGVIEIEADRIRFTHPLLAEAMAEMIGPRRRRDLHRRLAEKVTDPEERARHLALATEGPDAEVAAALDAGAAAAAARGAPGAAAELAEAAARLTPRDAPSDEARRLLDAALWHTAAGDMGTAHSLLEPLAADLRPGPERARVLLGLANTMDPTPGLPLLEQALEEAGGDPELQAEIQLSLGWWMHGTHGPRAALATATGVTELAKAAGNRELLMSARGVQLWLETLVGNEVDPDVARSLTDEYEAYPGIYPPALSAALWLTYRDRLDEARAVLENLARHAGARGDEFILASAALHLTELECRAGRYEVAAQRGEEALAFELTGLDQSLSAALYAAALADAYRGRVEQARAGAERGLELARSAGDRIFDTHNEEVLGFLDLSLGEARAAADRLSPLWPRLVALGYGDPSGFPVLPNAIHALLEAGDRPEAERLLEHLEERGRALDSAWALSQAARLRALIAADDGRTDHALTLIDQAVALHERMPGPFERGRTLLARGVILRRARRRREAREALRQALAIFDELGTPLWADKARAELGRIAGRTPTGDDLTPSERRIAELVAEGKTNKEVAAILVVADRTVESALTQIYRKLEVRSRTELARRLTSG